MQVSNLAHNLESNPKSTGNQANSWAATSETGKKQRVQEGAWEKLGRVIADSTVVLVVGRLEG